MTIFPSLFYSSIWTICYLLRNDQKKLQQVYDVCVCLDNSKHICSRCLQIFFAKYFGALGLTELWAEGRPIWASLSVWEQD